jgi:multicomponent Na+:H+ antiporter subunit C
MILIYSIAVAVLFGAGSYLMLKHDLIRLLVGMVLIGNAANLFIMAAGLVQGNAPIYPLRGRPSDPLVQSMTLTAIVISFAVSALVLALVYRLYAAHSSTSFEEISREDEVEEDDEDEFAPNREEEREDEPDLVEAGVT